MGLNEVVYNGAVGMLKKALAVEIIGYLQRHETNRRDQQGYAIVVRNGYGKERRITTG
jgi:hypothetical protein